MAELNEAVQVLGDPQRRAAYDRARSGPVSAPAGARPTGPATPVAADDDLVDVAPTGVTAILVGSLPWLLLIAVLVGIFVFTAYSGGGPAEDDAPTSEGTTAVRDVRGSCIRTSGGFVLVANCAQTPHRGEIVAQASDVSLCPAGTRAWEVPQEELVACTDPATSVP